MVCAKKKVKIILRKSAICFLKNPRISNHLHLWIQKHARTAMSLNPILLPGNVVPPLSCSVVVGDQDLTTRKWTTTDMKSPYTIFFFFPMTSAVDSAEIIALKVKHTHTHTHLTLRYQPELSDMLLYKSLYTEQYHF